MKNILIIFLINILLINSTLALAKSEQRIELDSFQYKQLSVEVIKYINELRLSKNKPILVRSEALELAAQAHASAMVKHDFFSHLSPVKDSKQLTDRLSQVGINNVYAAENLSLVFLLELKNGQPYYTRFDPEDSAKSRPVFSIEHKGAPIPMRTYKNLAAQIAMQWFNSKSHRLNMLKRKYNSAGVGAELGINEQKMPIVKVVMTFATLPI